MAGWVGTPPGPSHVAGSLPRRRSMPHNVIRAVPAAKLCHPVRRVEPVSIDAWGPAASCRRHRFPTLLAQRAGEDRWQRMIPRLRHPSRRQTAWRVRAGRGVVPPYPGLMGGKPGRQGRRGPRTVGGTGAVWLSPRPPAGSASGDLCFPSLGDGDGRTCDGRTSTAAAVGCLDRSHRFPGVDVLVTGNSPDPASHLQGGQTLHVPTATGGASRASACRGGSVRATTRQRGEVVVTARVGSGSR